MHFIFFCHLLAHRTKKRQKTLNGTKRPRVRPQIECLESRLAPAVISDGATSTLSIVLGASENLAIVSKGTTYTLTSNKAFTAVSSADPAGQNAGQNTAFAGFGSTTLSITPVGVLAYSAITISDAGAHGSVTFNDSGTNSYRQSFTIRLTDLGAGTVSFRGKSNFGIFGIDVSTAHDIQIATGASISTSDGNIKLAANQQATPTAGNFAGVAIFGTVSSTGSGGVVVQGRGGNTGTANYGVAIETGGALTARTGSVTVQGTGGAGSHGIYVSDGTISSSNNDVQITGLGGAGGGNGLQIEAGQLVDTASGTVISAGGKLSLQGTSPDSSGKGVYILGTPSKTSALNAKVGVEITGTGGGYSVAGVTVSSGAQISASDVGRVSIHGTTSTGQFSKGVLIDVGAVVSTHTGNIDIVGEAGGNVSGGAAVCIGVSSSSKLGAEVWAGGAGAITINGNLSGAATGTGVSVANCFITTTNADVHITGDASAASSGNGNVGVIILGIVGAGGVGNVYVNGTSGVAAAKDNDGVVVGVGGLINTSGGNTYVTGRGGAAGQNQTSCGVFVTDGGQIAAGGLGTVTVVGSAGPVGAGYTPGVFVDSGGAIFSSGGAIQIRGSGGASAFSPFSSKPSCAISIYDVVGAGVTAPITLIADSIYVGANVNAGSQNVIVQPQTPGAAINIAYPNIGDNASAVYVGLDRISAASVQIGNASIGTLTISTLLRFAQQTNLSLASGGDIIIASSSTGPGLINTRDGSLLLAPGKNGAIRPLVAQTDIVTDSAAVSFAPESSLAIAINGVIADTQYDQLSVLGDINLAGVNLLLSGNLSPSPGQSITIVNYQGAHAIIGAFNNLPEGTLIPNFLGSSFSARISYAGGDGNDVTLTVAQPTTTQVSASASSSVYGLPITFTATVNSGSSTPTGAVEFFDDTTGADLGPGTLSGTATTSSSWTNTTLPTQLGVLNSPHVIRAVYSSTGLFASSSGILDGGITITPAPLTVTGITAANKPFDYTTKATLNTTNAAHVGVFPGDLVTLSTANAAGTFASAQVGNNIPVQVAGLTVFGAQAANYTLVQPTVAANITPQLPPASVNSLMLLSGTSGLTPFTFQLKLPSGGSAKGPVTFDVFTTDGTAKAGVNYVSIKAGDALHGGTVTFAKGATYASATVYVIAGSIPVAAGTKTFNVNLSDPLYPDVALSSGVGTIIPQMAKPAAAPASVMMSPSMQPQVLVGVLLPTSSPKMDNAGSSLVPSLGVGANPTDTDDTVVGSGAVDRIFAALAAAS